MGGPRVTTEAETTARRATVTGLAGDVPVYFTATATNANLSAAGSTPGATYA